MDQHQVRDTIETGSVLIKDGTALPHGVQVTSEPLVPGWKIVTDCTGANLDREIHKAGWRYFCLATFIKATVFGKNGQRMIRRAIEQILNSSKLGGFNSLEIVGVACQWPRALPRLGRVTVLAQPRHIQQGLFLYPNGRSGADAVGPEPTESRTAKEQLTLEVVATPAQ